jgi:hypothetical protein
MRHKAKHPKHPQNMGIRAHTRKTHPPKITLEMTPKPYKTGYFWSCQPLKNHPLITSPNICNAELPMREASVLGVPEFPLDSSLNRTALWPPAAHQSSASPAFAPANSEPAHCIPASPNEPRRPSHFISGVTVPVAGQIPH